MELRPLGGSGVQVSLYCLGAMAFGSLGNTDHDDCVRIIDAAIDAGINTIDTADVYSKGESERIVGRALHGRRASVVVATKCFWPVGADPNERGLSRRHIIKAVEESLRRLRSDWIDILYLHKPDPDTALEESLAAASALVSSGKVRLIGTSSFPAELLVDSDRIANFRNLQRPLVEQPAYSLLARGAEADILPVCQRQGVGVMVFSPLNGGWLTGKYQAGRPAAADSRAARWPHDPSMRLDRPGARDKFEVVAQLSEVARQAGCSLTQLAMAFVVAHPAVTGAIIGPRTMTQLRQLLDCESIRLDAAACDRIDQIVAPGTDVDAADRWYRSPGLAKTARRRPAGERPAGERRSRHRSNRPGP